MPVAAGRLNKQVTIEVVTLVDDGGGGKVETWAELGGAGNGTVWARVSPLEGTERFQAQQVQAALTTEVEIRHRSDVTTEMRVEYKGRYFYIVQPPINKHEKGESLVLICEERQA